MSEINDDQTPMPEAPRGAAASIDPQKVNLNSQTHGAEYLAEKGDMMHPEALLDRFKELSESGDPVNAILITEVQEVKEYLKSLSTAATIGVGLWAITAVCLVLMARKAAQI